jgi:cytidylate kinase
MGRADAPLRPADDAIVIDTTDLTIEQAVAMAAAAVTARFPERTIP